MLGRVDRTRRQRQLVERDLGPVRDARHRRVGDSGDLGAVEAVPAKRPLEPVIDPIEAAQHDAFGGGQGIYRPHPIGLGRAGALATSFLARRFVEYPSEAIRVGGS